MSSLHAVVNMSFYSYFLPVVGKGRENMSIVLHNYAVFLLLKINFRVIVSIYAFSPSIIVSKPLILESV